MLTPHCSAVSGMVAPSSTAPITRARKSSEYGLAIHAGLLPAGSLNHIRAGMGIPLRFSLFGKRSIDHPWDRSPEVKFQCRGSRLVQRAGQGPSLRLARDLASAKFQ